MIFEASNGVVLSIDKLDRQVLDDLAMTIDKPTPPTKQVTIWDGSIEELPLLKDPTYQAALKDYYTEVIQLQLDILFTVVEIVELPDQFTVELRTHEILSEIGVLPAHNVLYSILDNVKDLQQISEIVFYISTVTDKGINEAFEKMDVLWDELPLTTYKINSKLPITASQYYTERCAAAHFNYKWSEFCNLFGWEQSEYLALYYIHNTISNLAQNEK